MEKNERTTYTRVNRIYNMEVVTSLENTKPSNFVTLLTGENSLINLPLTDVVKIYIEPTT